MTPPETPLSGRETAAGDHATIPPVAGAAGAHTPAGQGPRAADDLSQWIAIGGAMGCYESHDGGKTWRQISGPLADARADASEGEAVVHHPFCGGVHLLDGTCVLDGGVDPPMGEAVGGLSEDEREALLIASHTVEPQHLIGTALFAAVERILAARAAQPPQDTGLRARVEALCKEWEADADRDPYDELSAGGVAARLRDAIAGGPE